MVIQPLDRKLLRDLWRLRGQGLAIALIVASGVAVLVMSLSAMQALQDSSGTFYERYRFADVFAGVKRAPLRLQAEIAAIDGVALADLRVVRLAVLDMADLREPVIGRLVSVPDDGELLLNGLALRQGRLPEAAASDEVVVSEPFAEAHDLQLGDRFGALLNGRRRDLEVVGVALSPEFVYAIGPGALMPDAEHYGILWMSRKALAGAYDLEGAFNDVSLSLWPGYQAEAVIPALDRLLAPYGGIGAYGRDDQISHWFLDNEIKQLQTLARILPTIFLVVAAFLPVADGQRRLVAHRRDHGGPLRRRAAAGRGHAAAGAAGFPTSQLGAPEPAARPGSAHPHHLPSGAAPAVALAAHQPGAGGVGGAADRLHAVVGRH